MAFEVGSIYAKVGALFDPTGFNKFDHAVTTAQRDARKGATAHLGATTDTTGFNKYDRQVKEAERTTGRLTGAHHKLGGALKSTAGSLGGIAAGFIGYEAGKRAIDTTETLAKTTISLHKNLGLTVKAASEWAAVAKSRDVDGKALNMSFGKLSGAIVANNAAVDAHKQKLDALGNSQKDQIKRQALIEQGAGGMAKVFDQLGVSQKTLESGDFNKVIGEVADGLNKMGPGAERTRISMQLFGRGWQTIVPVLRGGKQAMQEQLDLANKYGATFGGKSLKSVEDMVKAQREAKFASMGLSIAFGTQVAPAITKMINGFARAMNDMRQGKGVLGAVRTALLAVRDGIQAVAGWLGRASVTFDDYRERLVAFLSGNSRAARVIREVWSAIQGYIRGAMQVIRGIIDVISGVLTGDFGKAWRGVKKIFSGGIKEVLAIFKGATAPLRGAAAAIGSAIGNALSSAWDGIVSTAEGFVNKIIDVINLIPGVHIGHVGGGRITGPGGDNSHPGNRGGASRAVAFAEGGKVTMPIAIMGEEAPQHPEWVIPTNPAYRKRALGLWAAAAHELGIPGFALGGVLDKAKDVGGKVLGAVASPVKALINKLPKPPGGIIGGAYRWARDKAVDWIKSKASDLLPDVRGGSIGHVGKGGLGTFDGLQVANWIIPILQWARKHGWGGAITSGYRSHAYNVSQGRNYHSNHEDTSYPGGAIDVGGYGARAQGAALAGVLAQYPGGSPLIWGGPVINDWGHFSATGHRLGGKYTGPALMMRKGRKWSRHALAQLGSAYQSKVQIRSVNRGERGIASYENAIQNLERQYAQRDRAFAQSTEDYVIENEDGTSSLDQGAIDQRKAELGELRGLKEAIKAKIQEYADKVRELITTYLATIRRLRRTQQLSSKYARSQHYGQRIKDYTDRVDELRQVGESLGMDMTDIDLDLGDIDTEAGSLSDENKGKLLPITTTPAGPADTSPDAQALIDQANAATAVAQQQLAIRSGALQAFLSPGDIGTGRFDTAYAAAALEGPSLASGHGGRTSERSVTIIQNVNTLHPADTATLDAIGKAATGGIALQGNVISPRVATGL